jgi:glycosyltransferase involved in cell wall biosynthesis
MVSYNQGEMIEESILSVLNQGYPNLELIIIDGKSSDNTICIIDKYRERIDLFISESDKGMYHARNKGILLATGDYVGFLNTDDLFFENALNNIGEFIVNNDYPDMIFGYTAFLSKDSAISPKVIFGKNVNITKKNYFRKMKTIPDQSTFYKKSSFSYVGLYDTTLFFGADTDLKCRYIYRGMNVKILHQIIAGWKIYDNTLTYRKDLKYKRFKEAIKVNHRYNHFYFNFYTIRLFVYIYIVPFIRKIIVVL